MMFWVSLFVIDLVFIFLMWFPITKKCLLLVYADFIAAKTKFRIRFRFSHVRRNWFFIGFFCGYIMGSPVREKVFSAIINIILYLRDEIIFISPYGRLTNPSDNFLFVLEEASGWTAIAAFFFAIIIFSEKRNKIFVRILVFIVSCLTMWYLVYFTCYAIVKIPICFKILSSIAVFISSMLSGLLVLMGMSIIMDKLRLS